MEKLMAEVLSGQSDKNMKFRDIQKLLDYLGFRERIRGDHYIYTKSGIPEKINIQPKGSDAKPYQVKQIRDLILDHKLGGKENV